MKYIMKKLILTIVIAFMAIGLYAQPPHPNGGDDPNASGNARVPGGGAPIGSGLAVLMSLGAVYGIKKKLSE